MFCAYWQFFNDKYLTIKLWFGGVSVGHWNLANAKLSSQKQKKFTQFFQKLRVWAAPIKIFRYNKLLCTDSLLSVCVKQNLKKQAVAVVNGNAKNIGNALRCLWRLSMFSFIALALTFAYSFKPPNSKLFGYRQIA